MKRGNFLKLMATMIVAPTLMGEKTIEPWKESDGMANNIDGDRIRIYLKPGQKARIGDLILSDMGDKAVIILYMNLDSKPYIEAKPICRGRYFYKDLNKFQVFARAMAESK